ncbi:MAG: zf-HC2 domain-containing protein [Lachnospiraceae bacterium]|nr:zf-HC2 domain-containing protein [Lachnospiraceae bacterium]
MDCKEFEKWIPVFLSRKMDFLTMEKFAKHMEECPGCSEELEIQFLVAEGMLRLEEGDAFDLRGELENQLGEAKRKVKFHRAFLRLGVMLEILAVLVILAALVWILI